MSEKPVLAVDVDGVVSLFGFEETPELPAASFEMVDGIIHCISLATGNLLRELAGHFDLVWASGWEDRTTRLARILDLPEYPYLTFGGDAQFGTADWKLGPLGKYAEGRPLAWVDDSFDESCYRWARSRPEPTLLVGVEPRLGLQEEHVEALLGWARSLAAERREQSV